MFVHHLFGFFMIVKNSPVLDHPVVQSFLNAFEHSLFSLTITDASAEENGEQILYVNQAFTKMTGYSSNELIGRSPRILQGPKTDRTLLVELKRTIYRGETFIGQTINYRKDGSEYIVRWSINPVIDDKGTIVAFMSCQMEVTTQVNQQSVGLMFDEALNQTRDGVMVTNLFGKIIYTNKAFSQLTGYSQTEMLGQNPRLFRSGKMDANFYKNLWQNLIENKPFEGMFINRHKKGHEYYEHKTITPILDHDFHPMYYLSMSRDATQMMRKTRHLSYQAFHDPLTGLHNRAKLNEVLEYKQNNFSLTGQSFSFILGDIDNFKQLNDTYGHDMGDQVLKRVAKSLQSALRRDDFIARWGGEEFVVLVDTDLDDAKRIAQMILEQVAQMSTDGLKGLPITLSFGVATYSEGITLQGLFERADKGLYLAKSSGKNCVKVAP